MINNTSSTVYTANKDFLTPFMVRADVILDEVFWLRANTTAANVYVGIYGATGTLLTDCAVDANTTVGYHAVSTTAITLKAGNIYYLALNQSAAVAGSDAIAQGDPQYTWQLLKAMAVYDIRMSATTPGPDSISGGFEKSRTNAALLSTQTMSGWTLSSALHLGGFVPQ
jgi:hypothetical protein